MTLILTLLAGAAIANPAPSGQTAQNLFPTGVGSTWLVRTAMPDGKSLDLDVKVASRRADLVVIEYRYQGNLTQIETYRVNAKEVARVSSGADGSSLIEPPLPVIKYPMKVGASWKWAGTIKLTKNPQQPSFKASADLKVGAIEKVKTAAGDFNAYRIDMALSITAQGQTQKLTNAYWYADKVGLVRQRAELGPGQVVDGKLVRYKLKG